MPEVSGHIQDNNRNIVSITPVGNMRPEKQRPPKQTVQAPPAHADQALQTTKHQSQTNAHPTHRVLIAAPHQVLTPPTHQPQTPPKPPARSLVSALCSIPKAPPRKRTRKCESMTVITSSPYKKVLEEKQKDKKSKTKRKRHKKTRKKTRFHQHQVLLLLLSPLDEKSLLIRVHEFRRNQKNLLLMNPLMMKTGHVWYAASLIEIVNLGRNGSNVRYATIGPTQNVH